jgi:hypothetical protein
MHADERLRCLAGLLGQLEQAYLDGDFAMDGVQFPDLVRHSFRVSSVSVNALVPGTTDRPGLWVSSLRLGMRPWLPVPAQARDHLGQIADG